MQTLDSGKKPDVMDYWRNKHFLVLGCRDSGGTGKLTHLQAREKTGVSRWTTFGCCERLRGKDKSKQIWKSRECTRVAQHGVLLQFVIFFNLCCITICTRYLARVWSVFLSHKIAAAQRVPIPQQRSLMFHLLYCTCSISCSYYSFFNYVLISTCVRSGCGNSVL